MARPDLTSIIRTTVTIALGGIGASAGFTHTHDWAVHHGQLGWLAWADAVVIEGMAVVAGFEVHRDHQAGRKGITLPQVVLAVAFLIQMTAQVAQAEPSPAGWLLAAMPALGFLTVVKLTMRRLPATANPTPQAAHATPDLPTPDQPAGLPRAAPAQSVISRLPITVRNKVISTTEQAHRDGHPVTPDEIGRTITLPQPMLADLITELNATINNHHVPVSARE